MKKIISLILAVFICTAFTACGQEKGFVLQRSSFNEETLQFTNPSTDITLTLPQGYSYYSEKFIANEYFGKTVEEMNAMTQEDYSRMTFVPDFIITSDETTLEVRYVNTGILLSGMENPTEEDYLEKLKEEKLAEGLGEEAFSSGTVTLGDNSYSMLTMRFSEDNIAYVMVRKISDNYMACVIVHTDNEINSDYFSDLFDGGVRTTDVKNVPVRNTLDEENFTMTNKTTGLIFSVPLNWYYYNEVGIAEEVYGTTAEKLARITPEEWAKVDVIADIYSYDDTDSVMVTYENITLNPMIYGFTETDYLNKYIALRTAGGWYCDDENSTVLLTGMEFVYNSLWRMNGDVLETRYIAARKINDDYICVVEMNTETDRTIEDFRLCFANEQGSTAAPQGNIALSSYHENSGRFYNPVTDLTIEIPDGWQLRDYGYIAENYYENEITAQDLQTLNMEKLARWITVYDFEAYNPETGDSLLVGYNKINYNSTGLEKITFDEYVSAITDEWATADGFTLNDSFTIEFETKRFHCLDIDTTDAEGVDITLIFSEVNEDYAMCLRADTHGGYTTDDILFLIYEGNTAE